MPERRITRLADYRPPHFLVETIDLDFDLDPTQTRVRSQMRLRRNPAGEMGGALQLDGEELELRSIRLDGRELSSSDYQLDAEKLLLHNLPEAFQLEIETQISPESNTALEGLYASGGNLCTQCEAEGFRKITFYPDRPDVMARFTTTLRADKSRYPVLLSNGNPVASGEEGERHWVRWEDPFPKPSYLFAIVAGDLAARRDHYLTTSGRRVELAIYTSAANLPRSAHAMASLKQAMAWDEKVFGLECDLDVYNIVAVDDFNMGAMENKGLNIFNSHYALASTETATDDDFFDVERVIAHEYFHNWTGNRVTCRDWFQLSLKEGLTVFRDQEFSADIGSRAVQRIANVRHLRSTQFIEDSGAMAHPVRPDSYEEINNFYTTTVYEKGAELIRMMHTLLGAAGFRRGMDLYFQRHDGQAVTTEDFVAAMADANSKDLSHFSRWYHQSGTPIVTARGDYDAERRRYTLELSQHTEATADQAEKRPLHLPIRIGLLDADSGEELPLTLEDGSELTGGVLELTEAQQRFTFVDLATAPIPSINRDFSAPIKLKQPCDNSELLFRMAHDRDPFNRWEAGQQVATRLILELAERVKTGATLGLDPLFVASFRDVLDDEAADPALRAETLTLPSEAYLSAQLEQMEVHPIHAAREFLLRDLASEQSERLALRYRALRDEPNESPGQRRLKNLCLFYLLRSGNETWRGVALEQFEQAENMTDAMGALRALNDIACEERERALEQFYQRWQRDPLVVDKWLGLKASAALSGTLEVVTDLLDHPAFSLNNPNRVRALVGSFCRVNLTQFHAQDGSGYRFWSERLLELDPINPQIAARLAKVLSDWRRLPSPNRELVENELRHIAAKSALSRDLGEVVGRSLAEMG